MSKSHDIIGKHFYNTLFVQYIEHLCVAVEFNISCLVLCELYGIMDVVPWHNPSKPEPLDVLLSDNVSYTTFAWAVWPSQFQFFWSTIKCIKSSKLCPCGDSLLVTHWPAKWRKRDWIPIAFGYMSTFRSISTIIYIYIYI